MKYRIVLRKCDSADDAMAIAGEVAKWSGSRQSVIYASLMEKSICIKREAEEAEAQQLRERFTAVGAVVDVLPAESRAPTVSAPAAATGSALFSVTIRKCDDPDAAMGIAGEAAKIAGARQSVVYAALMEKPFCVKRDVDQQEAERIKGSLVALGAVVDLQPVAPPPAPTPKPTPVAPVAAKVAAMAPAKKTAPVGSDDDDEEDEVPRRVRTDSELVAICKVRNDIFHGEKDRKIQVFEAVFICLGILLGSYLMTVKIVDVATDFYEKVPAERLAKVVTDLPSTLEQKRLDEEKKKKEEEIKTDKKTMQKTKNAGAGGRTGGGGDPRARVTRKGVLGIISGQVKGKSVASADVFGKGGYATGIDAILSGVGGLKAGGSGGVGRAGAAGIGYGAGYGSGFGGGGGGIDDLLGSLMGGEGGELGLKKRGGLDFSEAKFLQGAALTGGRSKASIYRVVMQNIAALRYAYNKRLREKPGLNGRITVKFAIDEFGSVIFCQVVSSTMSDSQLEEEVVAKIKRWAFGKIDKPGDVTEVSYPFVFNQ